MTKSDKVNLLSDLTGISLACVVAERLQLPNGRINPEPLAIRFDENSKGIHLRISGDSSGQFLRIERGKRDLLDLGEYGVVVVSEIKWGDRVEVAGLHLQRLAAVFDDFCDDITKVRIQLSDGSKWEVLNDCDNLRLVGSLERL